MSVNSISAANAVSVSQPLRNTIQNKTPAKGIESIWTIAKANIENAAEKLGYDKSLTNQIVYPERELSGFIHVDGIEEPIQVFRTQHNTILGPAKGGVRMMPTVDGEMIRGLATDMSVKNSLAGLPLGGGKGGIRFDSSKLTPAQREQLFRKFTDFMFPIIGVDKDIPAPDMFTNGKDMDIIMDEYSRLIGHNEPGVVTGKTLMNGGSLGRAEATGLGVVHTIEEAFAKQGINPKTATAAVQGAGNVGGTAARFLDERGVKVVAMSDMYGAIYNEHGLNVKSVLDKIATEGSLTAYKNAQAISNADLLAAKVDVLVPAAAGGQITESNAGKVLAKIIAEGANGPTTPGADKILAKKGIHVIPDVLANQGGVYVSHLEHIQNLTRDKWTKNFVLNKLMDQMKSRYNEVFSFAKNWEVSMREAASMIAVEKIANAIKARGRWV